MITLLLILVIGTKYKNNLDSITTNLKNLLKDKINIEYEYHFDESDEFNNLKSYHDIYYYLRKGYQDDTNRLKIPFSFHNNYTFYRPDGRQGMVGVSWGKLKSSCAIGGQSYWTGWDYDFTNEELIFKHSHTFAHEIGHMLGLGHTSDKNIMNSGHIEKLFYTEEQYKEMDETINILKEMYYKNET